MHPIYVKRIYEEPDQQDGMRILVDRIWPRGVSKEKAKLDLWMKEIAPSTELRTWYHRVPEDIPNKFAEFTERYTAELSEEGAQSHLKQIKNFSEQGAITLLFAAKEQQFNHAILLKQCLKQMDGR